MTTTKKLLSEEIMIDIQDYVLNPQGFVVLQGKNGRGKTHVALSIYQQRASYELPKHNHDEAWFINYVDLNMLFIETLAKFGHVSVLLREFDTTPLLVIDDLGTRFPSEAFKDFIYAIIDKRYIDRKRKGTVVTTNLTSTKIRDYFGDPVFSRMVSGRNYIFLGPDRRFTEIGF